MQQPAPSSDKPTPDKPAPAKSMSVRPASPAIVEPYQEQIYDTLPCLAQPPTSLSAEQKRALREFAGVQEDIYDTLPTQGTSKVSSNTSLSTTLPQIPLPLRRTGSDGGTSTCSDGSPCAKRNRKHRRNSAGRELFNGYQMICCDMYKAAHQLFLGHHCIYLSVVNLRQLMSAAVVS